MDEAQIQEEQQTKSDIEKMAEAVHTHLIDSGNKKDKGQGKNLITLAITVVLFISLGLFRNSISGIIMIVGVIFVHECGHFIGMKLLKYKDVKMFFIPLFGAAVAGKETAPSAGKKAVVSLLGPVPGILIGIGTGVAYLVNRQPVLADAARTFLFLNTFNLLPFYPLDGGHLVDALLFSRHPRIEIIFKIITTIILFLIALALKAPFFGIFAFMILVSLKPTYTSASIAHKIKNATADSVEELPAEPTYEYVFNIVGMLRQKLPAEQWKASTVSALTTGIWQRIRNRPCRFLPTFLLILFYLFFVILGIGSAFSFEIGSIFVNERKTEIVNLDNPNSGAGRQQVITLQGRPLSKTEINSEGLFHGKHQTWHLFVTKKRTEGQWKDGYRHAVWKYWDLHENLVEIIEYDMGAPIRYQKLIDGTMQEVPKEEWPSIRKLRKQNSSKRANSL